ncbi:MAG: endonuclease/exonuclease/phosphatase family protein, partial [Bacteroidia bacterium]
LKVSHTDEYLYLSIDVGTEINLQDLNDVTLYIDSDNNSSTGQSTNGLGADISYTFGSRSGSYFGSGTSSIRHGDLGLITAPTISSDQFEVALNRNTVISGKMLFSSNTIKLALRDNASNGDILPNNSGGVSYTFTSSNLNNIPSYSISKAAKSNLRILSYNVLRDAFMDQRNFDSYSRILKSVNPDIIGFQEIYNSTSSQVASQVESMLPSSNGEQWYHANDGNDCHAISRYPILKSREIAGNGAFLIDLPDTDKDLMLIVAHPPCCSNDGGRQSEVDQIMKLIRESKEGKGILALEEGAPILIVGDMNFVGTGGQLHTFLTGDISDNASHGSDFTPDWDGSDFVDAEPYATHSPFVHTWYNTGSSFSPGKLDYIIFSPSTLELHNSFVLFTPTLPSDSLSAYKLEANDVTSASDHLPVVADFSFLSDEFTHSPIATELESAIDLYPNPAHNTVYINSKSGQVVFLNIKISDAQGRLTKSLENFRNSNRVSINTSELGYGTYTLSILTNKGIVYKSLNVVR